MRFPGSLRVKGKKKGKVRAAPEAEKETMLVRNWRKGKSLRLKRTYRFGEDRRDRAAARDAGRRRAEEAAAVAAKPREAREDEAGVVDIADAAAAAATTLLLASDAATAPVLLLFRRAAAEAAPAPVAPIAIAARIATGAVLREAKREPVRERGGMDGQERERRKKKKKRVSK